jgi:menaquinone-dependent protoporphyrinogen IX oxidase
VSGIVVYRSSSGSTKQYAEWIAEETGFSIHDSRDTDIPWSGAEAVAIGCPIIANKPFLSGWIAKNWERMEGKNVVLFTTSGADPAEAPVMEWIEKSLSEEIRSKIRCFPLAGRFDYARLRGLNKAMIWIAGILLRNKDVRNQMQNPIDGVAKDNLAELLEYLKGGEQARAGA